MLSPGSYTTLLNAPIAFILKKFSLKANRLVSNLTFTMIEKEFTARVNVTLSEYSMNSYEMIDPIYCSLPEEDEVELSNFSGKYHTGGSYERIEIMAQTPFGLLVLEHDINRSENNFYLWEHGFDFEEYMGTRARGSDPELLDCVLRMRLCSWPERVSDWGPAVYKDVELLIRVRPT